jgi:hypothetical protein
MIGAKGGQAARLYINPPLNVSDPTQVPIPWKRGHRYVFPIRGLKVDRGSMTGSIDERREVIPL